MALLGAVAALGSSFTWAFASVRYSAVSREIGSLRVNLARALVVGPLYLIIAVAVHGANLTTGMTRANALWLVMSVICSYVLADSLFFVGARRVGVPTALSIASVYPLWAALVGVVFRGEHFGPVRGAGTVLCVAGVIILVRLTPGAPETGERARRYSGLVLAAATSVLWAGNSVAVKFGAGEMDVAQVNGIRYSVALVILAVAVEAQRKERSVLPRVVAWKALLPAIVADGVLGSSLFVYGLTRSDLAIGATLTSLAPLISVPIAIAAGEEEWNLARVGAVAMTVAGAAILVSAA